MKREGGRSVKSQSREQPSLPKQMKRTLGRNNPRKKVEEISVDRGWNYSLSLQCHNQEGPAGAFWLEQLWGLQSCIVRLLEASGLSNPSIHSRRSSPIHATAGSESFEDLGDPCGAPAAGGGKWAGSAAGPHPLLPPAAAAAAASPALPGEGAAPLGKRLWGAIGPGRANAGKWVGPLKQRLCSGPQLLGKAGRRWENARP